MVGIAASSRLSEVEVSTASYSVKGDIFVAEKPRVRIAKLGGGGLPASSVGQESIRLSQLAIWFRLG